MSKDGGPLPGSRSRSRSADAARTDHDDPGGRLVQVQALLPGVYHIVAELPGMGKFEGTSSSP